MGTSLFNTTPAATYPALIKVGDNTFLGTTLKTLSDGSGNDSTLQLSTRRLGVLQDTGVTTQTSSVIQATTTNANLVIAPNGTGALIASVPDGTATGGDARGTNAVDLQTSKNVNTQVASGQYSNISGGRGNTASNTYSVVGGGNANNNSSLGGTIAGGRSNTNSAPSDATIGGGNSNTASSQYGVISGGQTNTASTGLHATVVGGLSNTASGSQSVVSGFQSLASGTQSFAANSSSATSPFASCFGQSGVANSVNSFVIGRYGNGNLYNAFVHGNSNFQVGDKQVSQLITFNPSSNLASAATVILSLDGTGTTNLIIPNGSNRMWKVKVEWVATVTTITGTATGITVGDYVYGESSFGFKKLAGTSTMGNMLSDSEASDNAIMDTCLMTYTAGASQELALTFTGPTFSGGGSVTMRVVAKVALVEVAF